MITNNQVVRYSRNSRYYVVLIIDDGDLGINPDFSVKVKDDRETVIVERAEYERYKDDNLDYDPQKT